MTFRHYWPNDWWPNDWWPNDSWPGDSRKNEYCPKDEEPTVYDFTLLAYSAWEGIELAL